MNGKKHAYEKGWHHQNHKKPMTRRDLMAQGFLGSAGALLLPGLLGTFSRRAYGLTAADPVCSAAATARMVPVLVFDLAGGGNIAGTNVMVGGAGGQLDFLAAGNYATIGLSPAQEPTTAGVTLNTEYGLAFHPLSKMLAGMNGVTATTTRALVDGAIFPVTSQNDTRTNPSNPLYWLAAGGLAGSLVPLVGSETGSSGGNSAAPADSINPALTPSVIAKPADSAGIVDPGTLATLLGSATAPDTASVQKVMAAIKTMSESRLAQFQAQDVPSQVQDLIKCGYINANDYLSKFSAAALDPTQDALVTGIYKTLAAGQTPDPNEQAAGTIAKLILDGYAGAGVVTLQGFDYHGQGRATQDSKDTLAGKMIGQALELAAQKKQALMIYVITDGGVSATADGNPIYAFQADDAQRSASMSLVFNPTAKPAIRNNQRQIGAYKTGGSVDTTQAPLTSANVENLSKALAANWLALHGLEGDLAKATTTDPFGASLDSYLAFTKLT